MAHIHGVGISLNETDKPVHTISEQVPGIVWFSPCSGVNVFMPDNAEKAAAYLEDLSREIAALRSYYLNKSTQAQQ